MIQVNTVTLMTCEADPSSLTQNPDVPLTIQLSSRIWLWNKPLRIPDGYVNSHIGEFMTHFWANRWKINWRTLDPSAIKKKGRRKTDPMWSFFLWTQTACGRRGPLDNNDVSRGTLWKGGLSLAERIEWVAPKFLCFHFSLSDTGMIWWILLFLFYCNFIYDQRRTISAYMYTLNPAGLYLSFSIKIKRQR